SLAARQSAVVPHRTRRFVPCRAHARSGSAHHSVKRLGGARLTCPWAQPRRYTPRLRLEDGRAAGQRLLGVCVLRSLASRQAATAHWSPEGRRFSIPREWLPPIQAAVHNPIRSLIRSEDDTAPVEC